MSSYVQQINQRKIPSPTVPLPGGGVGRRRCGHGYQYPCGPDVIPPTPPGPVTCTEEIVVSQQVTYTYGPIDLGTVEYNAACPSIDEGGFAPYTTAIDLGAFS